MTVWLARLSPRRMPLQTPFLPLGRTIVLAALSSVLLSGCVGGVHRSLAAHDADGAVPKEQVTDYRLAQCDTLWRMDSREAMDNALYWLRAIDCAGRLTPVQAREAVQQQRGDSWESVFKQTILLDEAGMAPAERRQVIASLGRYRLDFPAALRPLMQTWHERQTLLLALTEERLRYQRLQESSDKQLDTLRTQQTQLQYQLDVTTRKLENLTDIERQLSQRKQMSGDLPDGDAGHRFEAQHGASSSDAKGDSAP